MSYHVTGMDILFLNKPKKYKHFMYDINFLLLKLQVSKPHRLFVLLKIGGKDCSYVRSKFQDHTSKIIFKMVPYNISWVLIDPSTLYIRRQYFCQNERKKCSLSLP